MTDQERFMKEAIRQAKKARALEEVPIGCVIVYEGKIIAEATTAAIQTKIHYPMQNSMLSEKPAGNWETGDLRAAPCM